MAMYYNPQVVRALTCDRIREARGTCIEGIAFDRPAAGSGPAAQARTLAGRLLARKPSAHNPSSATCSC